MMAFTAAIKKNSSPISNSMEIKNIIKKLEDTLVELDIRERVMIEEINTAIRRTKAEINLVLIELDNLV